MFSAHRTVSAFAGYNINWRWNANPKLIMSDVHNEHYAENTVAFFVQQRRLYFMYERVKVKIKVKRKATNLRSQLTSSGKSGRGPLLAPRPGPGGRCIRIGICPRCRGPRPSGPGKCGPIGCPCLGPPGPWKRNGPSGLCISPWGPLGPNWTGGLMEFSVPPISPGAEIVKHF